VSCSATPSVGISPGAVVVVVCVGWGAGAPTDGMSPAMMEEQILAIKAVVTISRLMEVSFCILKMQDFLHREEYGNFGIFLQGETAHS
jgi:hypothetical protein